MPLTIIFLKQKGIFLKKFRFLNTKTQVGTPPIT